MFNARRSKSCQRPARADDYSDGNDEDVSDLRETIAHLKESIMTHANSSAETMEQFATLQKAHDNLYGDYTRLQEQMDDAVELLKYLKEDKSNYEGKIADMTAELELLRQESKDTAHLNATNSQLLNKIETLEKSNKEARASLTKQQLEYETTLSNFLKERGELLDKVKLLEQESTSRENKKVEDLNNKLATSLEKIAQLQRERRILSLSQTNESSSTNALMEKMNERIEHLERDNRELLQETKDMKLYVTTMEEALMKKDDQAEAAENEFHNEKEELQQHLVSFQEQISEYQQKHESLQNQIQKYQQQDKSRQAQLLKQQQIEEGHKEILLENESLKHQIEELQDVVEEQSIASRQHSANLEKEMQERLVQRIAVQLKESKLSLEAQIREELESEYMVKQQEIMASYGNRNVSDLETKLREELSQVKVERERWKSEQEDLMKRIIDSQQQFEIVREGFKKKLEKEKNRYRELEREKEGQEIVIEKLSEDYHDAMNELNNLQAQEVTHRQSLDEQFRQQLEEEKTNLIQQHQKYLEESARREDECTLQIRQLQNEIEELLNEQTSHVHDRNRWEEEKQSLLAKCNEKDDEIRRAMEDLEELNSENADYLQKIEVYTNSMDSFEESRVKYSVLQIEHKQLTQKLSRQEEQNESLTRQLEQLNAENGDLQLRVNELVSDLTSAQLERDTLQQSLDEYSEMCSKLQIDLSSVREEHLIQNGLPQSALPLADTGLDPIGKENEAKDSVEIELRHQKVVDELQARITDSTSKVSKLINQLSIFSSEKVSLTTKLESTTLELSQMREKTETQTNKISQLEASIDLLTAERDAATSLLAEVSAGNQALSALSSEKLELLSVIDQTRKELLSVATEKAQALEKVSSLDDIVKELQAKSECLVAELDSSKSEIIKLLSLIEIANQQPIEQKPKSDESAYNLDSTSPDVIKDYDAKISALQSEIDDMKGARELSTIQANYTHVSPQINVDGDQLINTEIIRLRDNNVALEEAIQDIQVEKEDLEHENEELASKLADLTTQAKMMLLNNESLEEAIQDQQIEYEERIAELECLLADKYENDDQILLEQQVKADVSGQNPSDGHDMDQHTRVFHDSMVLRNVIDSFSESEPVRAAAENTVLSDESQTDDKGMRDEITSTHLLTTEPHFDRVLSSKQDLDDSENHDKMKAKMTNTFVDSDNIQASIRYALDSRSSELVDVEPTQTTTNVLVAANLLTTTIEQDDPTETDVAVFAEEKLMVTQKKSCEISPPQTIFSVGDIEEQVKKLVFENGKLAQRLGNAVADKEFAMITLSKLGAKMEELMERNRKLSNLAGLKSKNSSRGSNYYSAVKSELRLTTMERGHDPIEVNNAMIVSCYDDIEPSNPAPHDRDDQSAYSFSGSTILTYESLKRLEPESSYSIAGKRDDVGSKQRNTFGQDGKDRSGNNMNNDPSLKINSSVSQRVKFPGGEYFGSLNRRGQKHGAGKMKYDNGNEYEGEWMNDKRAGKGTTKYSSGNVYIGKLTLPLSIMAVAFPFCAWKAGKRHGFGVFHIKKTGDIYRGNWAHGLKSGPGCYEYEDGELDISFYKDDVRVGEGVRWSASRHQASRLIDGQLVGEEGGMPFEEATKLTKQLGFIV